ncbi:MAG: adenosylmethionine-8-amino-7-oxononanoate aminotransferase [Verrucomicrobia bacterium]|nr:MAG: adenosylmethionine-8-amino-7-oxononanoate aminotransferase [Verrucomicrobiota bacterium]
MRDWCETEPVMLVEALGASVRDSHGRWYLDGNASIWTNLHGHRHPRLDAAVQRQLLHFAHTSFLGLTHPAAAQLSAELVALWPPNTLSRVFLSDNGSTAIEVALKMAGQYWQLVGRPEKQRFVAFEGAYHGDTLGASSLGGVATFTQRFAAWHLPVDRVDSLAALEAVSAGAVAAVVIEPLVQGANQMRLWPAGLLAQVREWCDRKGVFLIADEVMTGFGRTGTLFACEQEGVVPDFVALAKGLTGGYMPLAATLTTERVFEAFLGGAERTLYYGHSYAGHALACAVALENLAIFREEGVLSRLQTQIQRMGALFDQLLRPSPFVHEIRQCGFLAGIELRAADGAAFPAGLGMGARVCVAARKFGLLTRPVRDTVILMPPYCIKDSELDQAVRAIAAGIEECCTKP